MFENLSVKEIQKNIISRQVSVKEVVEYYLNKIDKLNPDLNAIVLQKRSGTDNKGGYRKG